jgi:hypothetical protein
MVCKSNRTILLKRYILMKQTPFASTEFELVSKNTRKREFLDEMNLVVPTDLTGLIQPFAPASKTGSPPFPIATMPSHPFHAAVV